MYRGPDGAFVYSPSDLVRFQGSAFVVWLERLAVLRPGRIDPDERAGEEDLVAELGDRHEADVLRSIEATRGRVRSIARGDGAIAATLAALRSGEPFVAQGALAAESFVGYADFLERVPGPSALGDFHYEVADAKLSRAAKPSHLVQLCAYADLLERLQGLRPRHVHVLLRDGARSSFRTDDFFFLHRATKAAFLAAMAAFDEARPPEPEVGGSFDRWAGEARRRLEAADDLALVAGIRTDQVKKLRAAGVRTVAALAASQGRVGGIGLEPLERLREQARLQIDSRGTKPPRFRVLVPGPEEARRGLALLPPSSPGDVYFDMEGDPFEGDGLEYLFGAATEGRGEDDYVDRWGHDADGERRAFEAFVRWVDERRARDPGLHVYHYAAYERTALRRLMGCHGTCEDEVDAWLREGVLVDLYAVVRQGVRVGSPSYSLKDLEVLYGRTRGTEVKSGGESIVAYRRWRESGESADPAASPRLAQIRAYNRDDCLSTRDLVRWLRDRQREAGIAWVAPSREAKPEKPARPESDKRAARRRLAEALAAEVPADPAERAKDPDGACVTEMLSHLVEFHRREGKPTWWSLYDRDEMDDEDRFHDAECLANVARDGTPPRLVKKSTAYGYRFDPRQETKVGEGSKCVLAGHLDTKCEVEAMDADAGTVLVKFGPSTVRTLGPDGPPRRASLLLHEFVPSETIEASVAATATGWLERREVRPAVRDLLLRRPAAVRGHAAGTPLLAAGEDPVAGCVRVVRALEESVLCVQGPPGTGKTHTAAHAIAALLADGRRVGVTSNSHKAIQNLLAACARAAGTAFRCLLVDEGDDAEAFAKAHPGTRLADSSHVAELVDESLLVGGTAWVFAREDLADRFDVLFVDEAGQVSLANLVGMARSSKRLVLLGDPMQLSQPTQGVHPGDAGLSALDHMLKDRGTVPDDFGIFLPTTRRLHPSLCSFVSGAFYEDRLKPAPSTAGRVVRVPRADPAAPPDVLPVEAGLRFVPVPHEGNTQCSDEEVEAVVRLVDALVGREVTEPAGRLTPADVLVVAPYNLQVRALKARLPRGMRVGTVDRFQGQEARVAIVSLTTSDAEASPRGLEFLLDRRRLNVAISRAQSLSIVVGSPALARSRPRSLEQMRLLNVLCRILESATSVPPGVAWPTDPRGS